MPNMCIGVKNPSGLVKLEGLTYGNCIQTYPHFFANESGNWQASYTPALSSSSFGIEAYAQGRNDPQRL